jgi:hypothetical protein
MDRLTVEEARATAAHTLEVVYGLVENMREVISGEQKTHFVSHVLFTTYPLQIDRRSPMAFKII